ncbi:hypothetical protein ACRRTK_006093 [Alexandromys fortis]
MNTIKLYRKPIQVKTASAHSKNQGVGANIFIENPGPEINEKMLYDTFRASWIILQTSRIMTGPDTGNSRCSVSTHFVPPDSSAASPEAVNGWYLCNCPIAVSYASKKDSEGERHVSS